MSDAEKCVWYKLKDYRVNLILSTGCRQRCAMHHRSVKVIQFKMRRCNGRRVFTEGFSFHKICNVFPSVNDFCCGLRCVVLNEVTEHRQDESRIVEGFLKKREG